MEKIIIYGIILVTVILLIKKFRSFVKGEGAHECVCSSGGSCSGACHCKKERRFES